MSRRRSIEHSLQVSCVDYFRLVVPPDKALVIAIPNGGARRRTEAARLKREGVTAGAPDLVIILADGRTHWVEMKRPAVTVAGPTGLKRLPAGQPSDSQQAFAVALAGLGHGYSLIDAFEDWTQLLKQLDLTY